MVDGNLSKYGNLIYVEIVIFLESGSDEMCAEYEIHTNHIEVLFQCTTSAHQAKPLVYHLVFR